jgi:hypothetical protein
VNPALNGADAVPVAVVDGPYDGATLSKVLANDPINLGEGACGPDPGIGCDHGTFVMGVLGARRDAAVPGLCSDCRLLHVPLFVDDDAPEASVSELARAITTAVAAGAKVINLSLAVTGDDGRYDAQLAAALDRAAASGAILVVAAGNQARLATGQLLSHPVTVPVVALDSAGQPLADCNFGPSISRSGIATAGYDVRGYAPGGRTTVMSGTSAAAAVASGTLAQLWSERPNATNTDILAAIARLGPRDGPAPPSLDRDRMLAQLDRASPPVPARRAQVRRANSSIVVLQGEANMNSEDASTTSPGRSAAPATRSRLTVSPAHGAGGCACRAPDGACTCGGGGPSQFVYVLGTVGFCYPDPSVEDELRTVADTLEIGHDRKSPRQWHHQVLSRPEARYVARQLCWTLTVEGQPAYYLILRDLRDLDDLIECLTRPEPEKASGHHEDLDLFIGTSSLIPVEKCAGLSMPVLVVDQLAALKRSGLVKAFRLPPNGKKPAKGKAAPNPEDLFRWLVQSADNLGDTDEYRALNYLAVRGADVYQKYFEMAVDHDLDSIKVISSRLARERRIVDPVFAFKHRETGVIKKFFVRVDVSHLFPMIANSLTEYYDR